MIQRLPLAKYMGTVLIIWAGLVIAHVGAKNYAGILVLRFLLGMAEAGVSPCSKYILTRNYQKCNCLMGNSDELHLNVLQTSRTASPDGYLAIWEWNGNDGRRSLGIWIRSFSQYQPAELAADLLNYWITQFRYWMLLSLAHAGLTEYSEISVPQTARCGSSQSIGEYDRGKD